MLFNKDRAAEYMRRGEVDVLVAASPVNITYFSGYFSWLEPLFREYMMAPGKSSNLDSTAPYAIFPLEGEPALVITPLFAVNASDLWVKDLHIFGDALLDESIPPNALSDVDRRFFELLNGKHQNATPIDAVLSVLKARGLADARIGLEMEGLTPSSKALIERGLPKAEIKDCSNLIRLIRMVKTEDELSKLTRAAEISERAAMESFAMAKPGVPMPEIVQHYRAQVAKDGADFDHFAFGVRGLGIATESNHVLTEDDLLYVDFGCIYEYCFSDTGTTLAMREPSEPVLERHAALRACTRAGVEAMRPGVKTSEVQAAMWETLNSHGVTASFPHGHGLGLQVRDYPIIVADNGLRITDDCVDVPSDLPLEADMVINLEAMISIPGVGSLHIEQSFAVSADGSRPLVQQYRERPILPNTA